MRNYLSDMLYALTSAYTRKDYNNHLMGLPIETNIGKLFSILSWGLDSVQEQAELIKLWENLDIARGSVLDRYGENFGVKRSGAEDTFYRLSIKVKMLSQLSSGGIDTMLNAAAALFEIPVENIKLTEIFPARIRIDVDEASLTPDKLILMAQIATILKRIAAAGVKVVPRLCCKNNYEVPIRYKESIRFISSFYPRLNFPQLKLDGKWKLNGGRKLSGYDSHETIDFYPVSIRFQTGAEVIPKEKTRIYLPFRAGKENDIRTESAIVIKTSATGAVGSKEQVGIRASAAHAMGVGDITIHNKNLLSGGWKLNGGRKLNGGTETR